METKKYFFQQKQKRNKTKNFFKQGFDLTFYALVCLGRAAEAFGEALPKSDPRFALLKWMLTDDNFSKKSDHKTEVNDIKKRIKAMQRQGLIFKDQERKNFSLTQQGKAMVDFIVERYQELNQPWDGKFRIIIFDIPEKKKAWRAELRKELNLMQYVLLQRSVYVGKYPLAASFLEELNEAGISKNVFIFIAEQMDRQDEILKLLE
ncbi:MAG: hypothetical protein Q8N55_01000 [bacterium]|nr:hypothetical protein [bacterium]